MGAVKENSGTEVNATIRQISIGQWRVIEFAGRVVLTTEADLLIAMDMVRYPMTKSFSFRHTILPCQFEDLYGLTTSMLEKFVRDGDWERLSRTKAFQ